ncbi:polysaccharide biosynthesis/export family protein [Paludibacter jiangxiensis]|uniref:Polysaccharide export outer membrane protein n=1 Tax=Paludibacter jiangxiensis TaxID=681398 RepID=A0A161M5T9_9BACT|nr:polysaccharide biosynthesis/export family protein [Paludibacter jiangxiensis]GAT63853.1 polysaccharide export outer membrane protein [Paludibacter jiangxiensis]
MERIKQIAIWSIAALLLFSLASCVTNYTTQYLQTRKNLPQYSKKEYQWYVLKPNDQIAVRVLSINEDINRLFPSSSASSGQSGNGMSYKIYADSTVDLPFISHLKIGGLTLEAANQVIEKKIKEFDKNASVVIALNNDVFYIIGEAGKGQFPIYKDKLTIFQALALAGDIRTNGDRGKIKVIRETAKGPVVKQFDIRSKSLLDSEYYYVYPNDIIYVSTAPGSFFRIESFSSLMSLVTTSVTFLVLVLNTIK